MLPLRQVGGHDRVTSYLPLFRCTPGDSTESRGADAACTERLYVVVFAVVQRQQCERVVITSKALQTWDALLYFQPMGTLQKNLELQ